MNKLCAGYLGRLKWTGRARRVWEKGMEMVGFRDMERDVGDGMRDPRNGGKSRS